VAGAFGRDGRRNSRIGLAVSRFLLPQHQDKAGVCPSRRNVCFCALTQKSKKLAGQGVHRERAIVWPQRTVGRPLPFEQLEPSLSKIEQLVRTLWICAQRAQVASYIARLVEGRIAGVEFPLSESSQSYTVA
jgi:hypothetical protein